MSRIEQLIDEIEEYIDGCKPKFMSSTEIIVNKQDIDDLLKDLRKKTPEEIKHYQQMLNQRDEIINAAKQKAESLVEQATIQTNELISEHEIMQQAYAQANEVVTLATQQAQDILDKATIEANNVRAAAMQYMDDMLTHLERVVVSATQSATTNYETLVGSLNQYREVIESNLNELHPAEDLEPGEGTSGNDISVM